MAVLLLLTLGHAPARVNDPPPERPPNIVLFLSDDQGYADVGCQQHEAQIATPHIDRLADEGVRFTSGYASAYVCAPTRAGLLTGHYQQRFGFYRASDSRMGLPLGEITLADLLQRAGYATGIFGKWHLGLEPEYHPLRRGFDSFYGFLGHGGHDYFELRATEDHTSIFRDEERIDDTGYLTDNLAREAVAFIESNKDEPFFLYLPFNAVHAPLQAPKGDIARYDTGSAERDTYLAMLHRMDLAVGQVLDCLEREGLREQTLVVYLSDNGGAKKNHSDNGPLRGYKHSVYEGGLRVPFLVSWPGTLPQGETCDEPVISLDVLPTACAAAGVSLPTDRSYDGVNLLPLLRGEAEEPLPRALFWDGEDDRQAMRSGPWKWVRNRGRVELFDLRTDLGEQEDLSALQPEMAARLGGEFAAWRVSMAPHMKKKGGDPDQGEAQGGGSENDPTGEANGKREGREARRQAQREERRAARRKKQTEREGPDAGRPNVLLIICDDLNDHIGAYGHPGVETPAMDRLAAAGLRFDRAYCQYPSCGPSRASFLSGLYPEITGVLDNKVTIEETRPGTVSLPQLMRRNGYWTGGVGKVFHKQRADTQADAWDAHARFENEDGPVATGGDGDSTAFGPSPLPDSAHRDGKNARQVASWIEERAFGEKPFFIACGFHKPHVPFWAPQEYFDRYPLESIDLEPVPASDWDDIPARARVKRYRAFGFEPGVEDPARRRAYTRAYHACVSFVDAQIGLLLDALEENDLWENTIVLLISDHGYQLGDHFMWGKVTLFEECARVPLIIRAPGRTSPGTSSAGLVELVDLVPTLTDLCGIEPPAGLSGRSFTDLLDAPEGTGRSVAYTVVRRGTELGRAIRTLRWRYADWGKPEHEELYDLLADPGEHHNLARTPGHEEVLEELREHLRLRRVAASRADGD
jgi:iduronate 2-sulfatase